MENEDSIEFCDSRVLEFAGWRIHSDDTAIGRLAGIRKQIEAAILDEFRDQIVPEGDPRTEYSLLIDGEWHHVQCFYGYRPEVKTANDDKPTEKKKRERCLRLWQLIMAGRNITLATDVYVNLRDSGVDADGLELLALSLLNAGEQFTSQLVVGVKSARASEVARLKRAGKGELSAEEWRRVTGERDRRMNSNRTFTKEAVSGMIAAELRTGTFEGIDRPVDVEVRTISRKKSSG